VKILLEQLKASQGKRIVFELVNGRVLTGNLLSVDEHVLRIETENGIGIVPVSAVQIIWDAMKRSLSGEDMEQLAEQLQEKFKTEIACTGFPGFTCSRSYICRPPDTCDFSFACPGSYVPSFPSGGGVCPFFFCGPFQFGGLPCGPFQFQQPCSPFIFSQPCGPFTFGQPCGPFQFGGSQCGVLGGFVCPGKQFIGIAPGGPGTPTCSPFQFSGSQCGTVGGFSCAGQQFFGLAPMAGAKPHEAPLPPTDFAVHEHKKDAKE
jgi:sRNA-binding regulator protein Hfq